MILVTEDWTHLAKQLKDRVSPIVDPFLKRRGLSAKHPVHDFLFIYYTFSPTKLKQWVPSLDQKILITPDLLEEYPWLSTDWFNFSDNLLELDKSRIPKSTFKAASFVHELSENILKQPSHFNCFGLHEWAMVYKLPKEEIRHQSYPLRLNENDLTRFLESQTICCSHYDAYRFFTKEAKPLNVLNPVQETRITMEQGGCLHANMDLYKWSTRFWPWIGSDYILKTFLLALEGRELDMRASPYDLKSAGYEPICIETEQGRLEYKQAQKKIAEKSNSLREELIIFCKSLALIS